MQERWKAADICAEGEDSTSGEYYKAIAMLGGIGIQKEEELNQTSGKFRTEKADAYNE